VLHPDLKSSRSRRSPEHGLAEAVSLAAALPNLEVLGAEVVRLPKLHPGMLFGSGKVDEVTARLKALKIDLVLVDGPVTPVQQRNLEKEWGVKLLDRTGLILSLIHI
jgi:GTP-binding protein HflX